MNTSALTGLAALIRGGLTGYKDAKGMQRQAALDEAQQRKEGEDLALRQAALAATNAQRQADAAARQADKAGAERNRVRDDLASPFRRIQDARLLDTAAEGERYAGMAVDAPDGPSPETDQYGVIPGANEWNVLPPGDPRATKGYARDRYADTVDVLRKRSMELSDLDAGRKKELKKTAPPSRAGAGRTPAQDDKARRFDQKQMDDITKAMMPFAGQVEAIDGVDRAIASGALNDNFWASFLTKNSITRAMLDNATAEGRRQITDLFVEQLKATSGGAVTDSEALRSEMATFFASGVPIDKFIPAWESWKRKQMAKQNAALAGKDPAHIERWRQGLAEKRSLFGGGIQGPAGKLADQPPPPGVTIGGQ